ncbi:MAG TPA: dethiobiotin synthase, partial [Bradyrhizobium sp.]|nr:dethiobiotin synthase [Bradyrhizobium sp.]
MTAAIVVTGTDTGIGKTVFSAALVRALDGCYWKPVQSGLEEETDSAIVHRLSGLAAERILPERYRLKTPASPHLAATLDGISIDPAQLQLPDVSRPLVVEGAGGLLVPLTRELTYIDMFVRWRAPVVLCARTTLGTIN